MNPVDLIRELVSELEHWSASYPVQSYDEALLTRAQTFLASQPVVVEVPGCHVMKFPRNRLPWLGDGSGDVVVSSCYVGEMLDGRFEHTTPCTVHVVVTPGAR